MDAFSTNVVTKPEELFGRHDFINKIIDGIHGMNNCAIIGTRRFGKTCVLQQIKSRLETDESIFPILVDSRDVGNSNCDTSDVYRCLVALITEELYNAGIFTQKETFDLTKEIIPWDEWGAIYQQVLKYNDKDVESLFKSVIKTFSKRLNKTILLIIDEYEYLLTRSMKPEGFNVIRTLTQKPLSNSTLMPIKYLICGAKNWEIFQKEIDSGVLNQTGITEYLPPISKQAFKEMWEYEIEKKDVGPDKKGILIQKMDWAYEMSGGVPFYGKIIGNYICRMNSFPDYSVLSPFFWELVKNQLNPIQLSTLLDLTKNAQPIKRTDNIIELENEGIISIDKNGDYSIRIKFLADFMGANYAEIQNLLVSNNKSIDEYTRLVDDIFVNIKKINFTRRSKNLNYVFHPTDSDDTQTRMKTICLSDTSFESFLKHVYITYAERTSNYSEGVRVEGTYGKSLGEFKTRNNFFYAIGALRHMNTHSDYKERKNQMSISEALNFFSAKTTPVTSEGYADLQLKILRKMDQVLNELLEFVQNEGLL